MPAPEGTTFASASDGGIEDGGVVTWDIGLLGAGVSRVVRLTILPEANLEAVRFLIAWSELDAGGEPTCQASGGRRQPEP